VAQSRRKVLQGGLAALGGLIGMGAVQSPASARSTSTLTLYGRRWQVASTHFAAGGLPGQGDRLTAFGLLAGEPDGPVVGEFHGAYTALRDPGHGAAVDVATLEQHTFVLDGGTLVGSGVGTRSLDVADTFAIVGGTGRYAGARGTYVARQRHREFGGDGTADFVLTLLS
jgi:hypothetical protein